MRTPITYKEIPSIRMQSLAFFSILDDLIDYILDPFSQLDGSDIDG